ncbi:hypothetical protein ACH4UM_23620 [Streptomyces sp. NPDC020801]|uniref:hypothetical protein n=1 Tax=Streptomyces sp. NPDC020801 TaxID=3365093 RepID=UPI00379E4332
MTGFVDWYTDQLATYGIGPVTAVEAVGAVVLTCATGLAFHLAERARDRRRLRNTPAAPDNQPGTDIDLLIACRRINALPHAARKEDHS